MTLLPFLALKLDTSRKKAKHLLDARVVFVNDRRVWMAHHELAQGDRVEVQGGAHRAERGPGVRILHRDADIVVADKPTGTLAVGRHSVESELRERWNSPDIMAVHRLDRDTSGCLIFATGRGAREAMLDLFRRDQITKVYQAIVVGGVGPDIKEIRAPLDGQRAVTRLRVLSANRRASHLQLKIETGRTHQIRRHMALVRHPVVGDKAYATHEQPLEAFRQAPRQMLHAVSVSFRHPGTGGMLRVTSPLPRDYRACLASLRLK